ncbi:MAG: peroxiredoxin [Gammaproteobacteria bacterium]|nr:peroxiredoxin [Gammaproteobacteria bacterium]
MLQPQQPAPAFNTVDQDDRSIKLEDFMGNKNVVLYFYPKDDTTGCTIEANQFTALVDEFAAHDTVILGVSRDNCSSHRSFIDKFGLQIDLLADTSGRLCEDYGVWQEKEKNGEKKMGIVRSTFIINKQGMLVDVEYGVTAEGHAQNVLQKVRQI